MERDIERRKPYNFNTAIVTGFIGLSFSFVGCLLNVFRIFDESYKSLNIQFQFLSIFTILANVIILIVISFLLYFYKKLKLKSGVSIIILALILICFFQNHNSGLIILLSGFFGTIESMYRSNAANKGYSYYERPKSIVESRQMFSLFMPEI